MPVPSYHTWKNSFGYSAKVEVANNTFKSAGILGDRKEAEQGAAYTALINLGLIDSSVKFDVKTATGTVNLNDIVPLMTRPNRNSELCFTKIRPSTKLSVSLGVGRSVKCYTLQRK